MSEMSVDELRKDLLMVNNPEFEKDRVWLKEQMTRILRDKLDQQQEAENKESRRLAKAALEEAERAAALNQRSNRTNGILWIISLVIGLAGVVIGLLALLK